MKGRCCRDSSHLLTVLLTYRILQTLYNGCNIREGEDAGAESGARDGARCCTGLAAREGRNGAERTDGGRAGGLLGAADLQLVRRHARTRARTVRPWVAAYNREHVDDGRNAFEANGLSHLRLARTERHLFQFLYLSPHMEATSFAEVYESVAVDGVQQCIEELGHLSPAAARALYLHMIVYTHGMAAMLVAGAQFSDEELGERLNEAFTGLLTLVR